MYDSNSPYNPPPMAPAGQTSTLAIVSLISGVVSWVLLPFIAAILGAITGHMAKNEIQQSSGRLTGDGLATAGLILSYINLAMSVCLCCVVGLLFLLPLLGFTILAPLENLAP